MLLFFLAKGALAAGLTLAWNPVASPGLSGYMLYYGPAAGNYPSKINVGNTTGYTVSNLVEGATYHFVATSYDASHTESPVSNDVIGIVPYSQPVAEFTASTTSGMAPLALNFLNASTGSITSYAWTFGDGGTSTVASPTHVYSAAGVYTVSLAVTGPGGSKTLTRGNYVRVSAAPVAQFTGSPISGGSPLMVAFTNTSTGNITSYAWTLGDGGTSTAASPSHSYAAAGIYTVSLKVTGPGGSNTQTRSNYVTVNPAVTGTTVVLQRGLNGYAGVSDTYTDNYLRTSVRGGLATLLLHPVNYNPLIRFAIFQSEGGPVPDRSKILSATLALYKQYYSDTIRLNALLKPWVESQATWTVRQTGVPWTVGGAAGAGTDYSTATDALVTPSSNPGWVTFNVTPRVSQWSSGSANYGWRMVQTTTGINSKTFYSSEYATLSLRPKLTVVYN